MNRENREFYVVHQEQRGAKSFLVFEINQISSLVRRRNFGQFVKSRPFELNYPLSIGKATFALNVFLDGPHETETEESVCVNLEMIQCEHQSTEFNFGLQFQLESLANVLLENQKIRFDNVQTRWIGAKFSTKDINEIIKNGSEDNILMMALDLKEYYTESVLAELILTPAYNTYNNNYSYKKEFCVSTKSSPQQYHSSNQSNIGGVIDVNCVSDPQRSKTASGSANTSTLFDDSLFERMRLRYSNLNYVDNDGDEDVAQSSNNPGPEVSKWIGSMSGIIKTLFKQPK